MANYRVKVLTMTTKSNTRWEYKVRDNDKNWDSSSSMENPEIPHSSNSPDDALYVLKSCLR